MPQVLIVTALLLVIVLLVIVLFRIEGEPAPGDLTSKPREGGTDLMPAVVRPSVPDNENRAPTRK